MLRAREREGALGVVVSCESRTSGDRDTVTHGDQPGASHLTSAITMTKNTERLSPDRQLSRQDVECLKEAFKLFDCDSNGRITVEELGKVPKLS